MDGLEITSQNGSVQVAGGKASFSASKLGVNLDIGFNLSVSINRKTKEITVDNKGLAPLDEKLTIGEIKAMLVAKVTELDANL